MIRLLSYYLNRTSFFVQRVVYYAAFSAVVLFVLSFFIPLLFPVGLAVIILLPVAVAIDVILLYGIKDPLGGERIVDPRFSNGDENKVRIEITNNYGFKVKTEVIDELPFQFQERKWKRVLDIDKDSTSVLTYTLKPQVRGEYEFGNINIFVSSPLKLVIRRFAIKQTQTVKVYPSYVQARRYQLLAAANRLQDAGVKKIRSLGHSLEFEQIKEYVRGDDYRTVNWKATARRGDLMVNNYTDERSQQIYCIVNKGRVMKMPFEGMSLLDYAINASLVLSNVALMWQDKAGLITFAEKLDSFITADKKPGQLNVILEALYRQETNFLEVDFEKLFAVIRNRITQRSLIVLFTNFESIESLERELPSLKRIAHYHLLMVVFFENTELKALTSGKSDNLEDIYIKTIAEKFVFEKKLIVKELRKNGIVTVLTTPGNLTINTINKYLELKNRKSI
jgi:uncharacterized protein (DUF58 family)